MTFFARAWKCGFRAASGLSDSCANPLRASADESAMPPSPTEQLWRKWRRVAPSNFSSRAFIVPHRIRNISSRFKRTFPTTVHAASSATSAPSGAGPRGLVAIAVAFALSAEYRLRASSYSATRRSTSASRGGRARQRRKPYAARSRGVAPPSAAIFRARACEHSTYTGSFMVTSAWSGVLVGIRFTRQTFRSGRSKGRLEGYGTDRRQNVYMPRRSRSSPLLGSQSVEEEKAALSPILG